MKQDLPPSLSSNFSKEALELKLLALDVGDRRIGLAVNDGGGVLVIPSGHLVRTKLSQDIDRVLEFARDRDAEGFVVGIPYSLDGGVGPGAKRVQGFVRALKRRTTLPVYSLDERFTSVEAEALLREAGRSPSRDKAAVDAAAAALILQRFLESQKE